MRLLRHLAIAAALHCVVLIGAPAAIQPAWAGQEGTPFVMTGVVNRGDGRAVLDRFVAYLSAASGYPMHMVTVDSYQDLTDYLRAAPAAVGWTCGRPFVEDNLRDGQQLVAVPLFNGTPRYHSLILARAADRRDRLAAFQDATFAYSDARSNSGLLAPTLALKRQGIDVNNHFRLMLRTGLHENSIRALLYGLADVAAVDEYMWVRYLSTHPGADARLRVVEKLGPFPFTPVVAGRDVPEAVMERLRAALVAMDRDPEGSAVLRELELDGFVREPVAFFDPIRAMLREVGAL